MQTTNPTVKIFGEDCTLEFERYKSNNTIAITAMSNGEPFTTITVNYEANWEGANEYAKAFPFPLVVIKNYSENHGIVDDLQKAGVIEVGGAYLSGSGGTVEGRKLTEQWIEIAKAQLKIEDEQPVNNSFLQGLTLPFKYEHGQIVDGAGKPVIKANRNSNESPVSPAGRDALLKLTVVLLNEAFEYDKADSILKKLDY